MTATIHRFPHRERVEPSSRAHPPADLWGAVFIAGLALWSAVFVAVCSWAL